MTKTNISRLVSLILSIVTFVLAMIPQSVCATYAANVEEAMLISETTEAEFINTYDVNGDGEVNIADAIICNKEVDEGRLSVNDFEIVLRYILDDVWPEITYEEWDLDSLAPSEAVLVGSMMGNSMLIHEIMYEECYSLEYLNDVNIVRYNISRKTDSLAEVYARTENRVVGITDDGELAWAELSADYFYTPSTPEPELAYDLNSDGCLDVFDVAMCRVAVDEGTLSVTDLEMIESYVLSGVWSNEIGFTEYNSGVMEPSDSISITDHEKWWCTIN